MIDFADAVKYVRQIETGWYGKPFPISSVGHCAETGGCKIRTDENDWSVWVQTDGTLYGEC